MTRLEQAKERLEKAMIRLDAAARRSAAHASGDHAAEQLAESLTEALQATQAEYAALRDVTETVSNRLDAAIDRLRGTLGG